MVWHDQVRPLADDEPVGQVDAPVLKPGYLIQQRVRVHDDAVADDARGLRPEDAGRHQVELELPLLG